MKSRLLVLLAVATSAGIGCRDATEPNPVLSGPQFSPQAAATNWVFTASMHGARQQHGAATGNDGRIYVFGGTDLDGFVAGSEVYDPANDSWSEIASPPGGWCCGGVARGLDGRIYLAGGENTIEGPTRSVKIYDPAANSWSSFGLLNSSREAMALAASADGKLYAIGGGQDADFRRVMSSVQVFDPTSGTSVMAAPMGTSRWYHAATLGPDGKIYVFGGMSGLTALASAEVYDPANNTWSAIAPMPQTRYGHAAVTGGDGRIYVMGGIVNDGGTGTSVLAYNPQTNTWDVAPSMNAGRSMVAASLGLDNKIYIAGGAPPFDMMLASAESYATVVVQTNRPPVAFAGVDQTLQCVNGAADAHLDGSASSDPDNDPLTFAWLDGTSTISTTATADVHVGLGGHPFTLRVTDSKQASSEDEVVVTVEDTRPPTIQVLRFDDVVVKLPERGYKKVAWFKATDECQAVVDVNLTITPGRTFGHENDPVDPSDTIEPRIVPADGGYEVWLPATHDFNHSIVYAIKSVATDASGNTAAMYTYVNAVILNKSFVDYSGKLRK